MRYWITILVMTLALFGCAAKGKKPAGPKPTGFASADTKNIHDFLARYPEVLMSGDVKALLLYYTEDARIVPFIGHFTRPIRSKDIPRLLPGIVAEERKAELRVVFREPMNIVGKEETATAQVVADVSWKEKGKQTTAVMNCFFGLSRVDFLWKIRELHAEPVKPGFALPAQGTTKKPLPQRDPTLKSPKSKGVKVKPLPVKRQEPAAQPAPQDTGASPGPLVPDDEQNPQPLF
jgi:ketosteroid isomerase-like protein